MASPSAKQNSAIIIDHVEWLRSWAVGSWGSERGSSDPLILPFKFLDFHSGISESYQPRYNTEKVLLRHAPYLVYGGGSSRSIQFSAIFMDEEIGGESLRLRRILQALMLPWQKLHDKSENTAQAPIARPPEVLLSIFPGSFMLLRGVVKRANIVSITPLVEPPPDLQSPSNELVAGQVTADLEFVTTATVENSDLFHFVNRGHSQFSRLGNEANNFVYGNG